MDDQNQIASFLTFTSCSNESEARQFLEMAGGNLEIAVSLYTEMGGGMGGGMIGSGNDNLGNGPSQGETGGGVNHGFDFDGARASSSNSSSAAAGPDGLDPTLDAATRAAILAAQGSSPIRAPDQTRTMRLVGGDSPGDAHSALLSAVAGPNPLGMGMEDLGAMGSATWGVDARSSVNQAAARRGNSREDALNVDESDGDSDEAGSGVKHAPSLSTMFAAPTHLMHRAGGFQGARNVAKDARRWLLVNVQSDSDFACHALNRDVWRDELVENLVREGFIFWQVVSVVVEFVDRFCSRQ